MNFSYKSSAFLPEDTNPALPYPPQGMTRCVAGLRAVVAGAERLKKFEAQLPGYSVKEEEGGSIADNEGGGH